MFSIFQKKKANATDLHGLVTDMHSHLIPGIDDGAPDMQSAISMIRGMASLGYRKLITTPHIQWDMYKNSVETITAGCQAVTERLQSEKIDITLRAAAEYFVDEHFEEIIRGDEALLTIHENMVLIEFSFARQPNEVKDTLFRLQIKGYQPIIAHPERYLYFFNTRNWYDEMKELGCLFQLNILSLCGFYGKRQIELAEYLIKKNYVDFVGTDLHNPRHVEIIRSSTSIMDTISKLLEKGVLLNPKI